MLKNVKGVPRVIFGRGCFSQLNTILSEQRKGNGGFMVFLIDDVFKEGVLAPKIPVKEGDLSLYVTVDKEPSTHYVDALTQTVKTFSNRLPAGVIGIGGGSTMDLTKAVSLMLTNPGTSTDYQGWDLIKYPAVYHVGIPTLSGTGAEVSRTTVLIGPEKKLGINSDYTVFDQLVLDPELTAGVPPDQRFYTGMDCYIHCVEALSGTHLNAFSQAYGEKALDLCMEVFLSEGPGSDDKLMMASYFGGLSIAYSQVGICHALSYGLSFVLGIHHGISNCIVFEHLKNYYPKGVNDFQRMIGKIGIELPRKLMVDIKPHELEKMIDVALVMEPLWENALGKDWPRIATRDWIKTMYLEM